MTEQRPPIHLAPDDWQEVLDLHRELIERKDKLLRTALQALKDVVRIADRQTVEFDAARDAIAAIQETLKP